VRIQGLPASVCVISVFCLCCVGQNIIHRDLKPANIIRKKDGRCVIVDFGLSKDTVNLLGSVSHVGILKGTPVYSAPEALLGTEHIVKATDVFALGVILYEVTKDVIADVVWCYLVYAWKPERCNTYVDVLNVAVFASVLMLRRSVATFPSALQSKIEHKTRRIAPRLPACKTRGH